MQINGEYQWSLTLLILLSVACSPASGTLFRLGNTQINCTACDAAGNTANAMFNVTVKDTTAAIITSPADINATSMDGNPVNIATSAAQDLPPDPGPAGEMTLAGIDSDNDGVRDDVQRWIALTYPNSQKVRAALTQSAKLRQKTILDSIDPILSLKNAQDSGYPITCLAYIDPDRFGFILDEMDAIMYNTLERTRAIFQASKHVSGHAFSNPPMSQWKQSCDFDPDTMLN